MKRTLLCIALMIATTAAGAASWTYRGTLNDGGTPANGSYDLRVTLLNEAKSTSVSVPITLYAVAVKDGAFAVEVDFGIDLSVAPAMNLKTEVQQGGSGFAAMGEPTPFDPKSALAGICWDTEGTTGILGATNFVGSNDAQTVVLKGGRGVSVNLQGNIPSTVSPPIGLGQVDMQIGSVNNIGDATIEIVSGSAKRARISKADTTGDLEISAGNIPANSSGVIQFPDYRPLADKNTSPMATFGNRIRSRAAGTGATDTSGGMWVDDERAFASFVGRGDNANNFTGFFSATSGWNVAAFDNGSVVFNGQVEPVNANIDYEFNPKAVASGGDADVDINFNTRSGKFVRMYVADGAGTLNFISGGLTAGSPRIVAGGASLSNGGVWTNASSRALKTGFAPINTRELLQKVISLPLSTWTYKGSKEGTHMGPMAEDFKEIFGLAGDGKAIGTVDADGVALAAIQGLNQKLEAENAALKARLDAIEAKLN